MNQNGSHIEEHLLLQYLLGTSADEDRLAVEGWLRESEANRAVLDKLEALWLETGKLDPPPLAVDIDAGWLKLSERMVRNETGAQTHKNQMVSNRSIRYTLGVAASVILLIGLFSIIRTLTGRQAEIELASVKEVVHDTLSDGTMVALNLNSKLVYPEKFNKHNRMVKLTGEGFFEVKRDVSKPFFVLTGMSGVRVLGTTFSVKAYPGKAVEVSVTEGRVQFFRVDDRTGDTLSILIEAGERGVLMPGSRMPELKEARIPDNLFWANRSLEFNGTPLSEVFTMVEQYFNVVITTDNPEILSCRLSATFVNDPPDRILAVIAESFGLALSTEGRQYKFSGNGCSHGNN